MNYEVWLHAHDPKTRELISTLRVFAHPDQDAAKGALENAKALFEGVYGARVGLPFGALVTAVMHKQSGQQLPNGWVICNPVPVREVT